MKRRARAVYQNMTTKPRIAVLQRPDALRESLREQVEFHVFIGRHRVLSQSKLDAGIPERSCRGRDHDGTGLRGGQPVHCGWKVVLAMAYGILTHSADERVEEAVRREDVLGGLQHHNEDRRDGSLVDEHGSSPEEDRSRHRK